jgi:capsule polysaccharide export protein KpsC/LpsZ
MQPELTTTPLGGVYENQLYAIECIINLIPNNWKVFVKEHPAQFSTKTTDPMYWRDWSFFYKKIQRIPQIVLISNKVDTNKLIENSQFVSTITGTAGWEAILAGKPALYFGIAWYGSFSGCTKFTVETTLKNILENKPDRNKIQNDTNKLAQKLIEGIVISELNKTVTNFDINTNAVNIANARGIYIEYYFRH